jgi:putative DNA primase/helicase
MNAADLVKALGGGRRVGRQWLVRCPAHPDRTPSLSLRDSPNGPLVHCHAGCSQRDVVDVLKARGLWPSSSSASRPDHRRDEKIRQDNEEYHERQRTAAYVARIWREAQDDPRGTPAERYLAERRLTLPADLCGRLIRFHQDCVFGKGATAPCLVARFSPIENDPGEDAPPPALLRVNTSARREAPKGERKRTLGPIGGCAIKLDADEDVTLGGIGIAQGLEDALDIRQRGWRPLWMVNGDGALAIFPVLADIECLTIFPDNDERGRNAAHACAARWRAAGREVAIILPRDVKDWNGAGR